MDRNQKAAVIEEVAGQIEESQAVFAVDYRGITVTQAAELRTKLRAGDASFRVVKNTLTERAAEQAGADGLKVYLEGPTALAFVRGDAAAAAKAITDLGKTTGLLAFKGGWMDGRSLTGDEIVQISRLPTREVLYGQLVGLIASPLNGLAAAMGNLVGGLARQLQAIADQGLVGGGAAPAEATAPAAEAAPAADEAPADAEAAEEATDVTVATSDATTEATEASSDATPEGAGDTTDNEEN